MTTRFSRPQIYSVSQPHVRLTDMGREIETAPVGWPEVDIRMVRGGDVWHGNLRLQDEELDLWRKLCAKIARRVGTMVGLVDETAPEDDDEEQSVAQR